MAALVRWLAFAVAFFVALGARADDRPRALRDAIEVSSPRCLEAASLATAVATWLQIETIDPKLRVLVTGDPASEVSIVVSRGQERTGQRSFRTRGMTCPNVTALVALAIAMAVDASAMEAHEEPTPETHEAPPPPRTRAPPPPPAHALRLAIGLEAVTLVGVLQRPALAGAFTFGIALGEHAWLRLAAWQTTTARSSLANGVVATSLSAAEVSLCAVIPTGPALSFRGCAGFTLGRLVATGSGYDQGATADFAWPAPSLRIDSVVHVRGPLYVTVFFTEMSAIPRGPELDVMRAGTVVASTTLPPASLAFGVGFVLQFP